MNKYICQSLIWGGCQSIVSISDSYFDSVFDCILWFRNAVSGISLPEYGE